MHAPYVTAVLVLAALAFAAAATFRGWWRREHPRPVGTLELAALAIGALGGVLGGLAVLLHVHVIAHPYPAAVGATALTLAALVLAARAR
ncbi:hypothetical protein [Salarchaeum japonicum]|uniref:GlsB/YeaQ/YmgE family stress response membrane protein n=1 Tax=Salarchaeum japonicum TaxID=555573 RepID=A0AAV3SZS6_9EURY|nr:hypothetical protein [Salarchaeum japonicum]